MRHKGRLLVSDETESLRGESALALRPGRLYHFRVKTALPGIKPFDRTHR